MSLHRARASHGARRWPRRSLVTKGLAATDRYLGWFCGGRRIPAKPLGCLPEPGALPAVQYRARSSHRGRSATPETPLKRIRTTTPRRKRVTRRTIGAYRSSVLPAIAKARDRSGLTRLRLACPRGRAARTAGTDTREARAAGRALGPAPFTPRDRSLRCAAGCASDYAGYFLCASMEVAVIDVLTEVTGKCPRVFHVSGWTGVGTRCPAVPWKTAPFAGFPPGR